MDALMLILIFAGKAFVIVAAILVVVGFIAIMAAKSQQKPLVEIEDMNLHYRRLEVSLKAETSTEDEWKVEKKNFKKSKKDKPPKKRLFLLDFDGDIKASAVESLREEVTALLTTLTPDDEVVVRVESPGGVVHGYGLAAAQLVRIRDHKIPLTICVDKVAASGGYMMACTANKILCAPFGIVGSVGVVAQIPNFHKLLKKHDVDFKEYTAGEFKRTVSLFGEITPKGEQKFIEQLEDTHQLFKNFVHKYRPTLDLQKVATGEYWFGENALSLGLVDQIMTSDAYLTAQSRTHRVYKVKFEKKQKWNEKFSGFLGNVLEKTFFRIYSELDKSRLQ